MSNIFFLNIVVFVFIGYNHCLKNVMFSIYFLILNFLNNYIFEIKIEIVLRRLSHKNK